LGIPTRTNRGLANGHDLVIAYTFADARRLAEFQTDPAAAERAADRLLATISRAIPGLADAVVHRRISTLEVPSICDNGTAGALGWAPVPEVLIGDIAARALRRRPVARLAAAVTGAVPRLVSRLAGRTPGPKPVTAVPDLYLAARRIHPSPGMNNFVVSAAAAAYALIARSPTLSPSGAEQS
jgi:hypothetical protein